MKRREFIIAVAAGLFPCVGLRAQQPAKPARIGILGIATATQSPLMYEILRDELRRLGYIEGKGIVLEFSWAEGRPERFPALARELAVRRVDVIFAAGMEAALAAKQATSTIPIVFVAGGDPVEFGLVPNITRPGGNITGVTLFAGVGDLTGKLFELLREVLPHLVHIATIGFPKHFAYGKMVSSANAAGRALRIQVDTYELHGLDDVDQAFAAIAARRTEAVVAMPQATFGVAEYQARVANLAFKHRLPLAIPFAEAATRGALFGYNAHLPGVYSQGARQLGKVLNGAAPGDLPIEQPTHFILAVNLKAAKALGIAIPPSILARADEVIE